MSVFSSIAAKYGSKKKIKWKNEKAERTTIICAQSSMVSILKGLIHILHIIQAFFFSFFFFISRHRQVEVLPIPNAHEQTHNILMKIRHVLVNLFSFNIFVSTPEVYKITEMMNVNFLIYY